ncbi:HAD hydrolase family protein [Mycobacterium sp. MBM]|nr:HAD hydrolase family protein [Mycobacterium sp. MBM]
MVLTAAEQSSWVNEAALYKGIVDGSLKEPLEAALKAFYLAVAFDIDGTLTKPGSADLDPAMCAIVARLLRRGCHVWLVTGRGSAGARKAIRQLLESTDLLPIECARLRCIAHNGAAVFEANPTVPEEQLFDVSRPLIPAFDRAAELKEDVAKALAESAIYPETTTLEPGRVDEACGLRIVFRDLEIRDGAVGVLVPIVERYGDALKLRTGVYQDVYTIDVTVADKALAVRLLAEDHRLDPTRVLCIGDQGGLDGNDGTFLAGATGFSVGTISNSPSGCFPVVSADGGILDGAAATQRLLDALCVGAPLRMKVDPGSDAASAELQRLLNFERAAVRRAGVETRSIERQLSLRVAQLIAHDPGDGDYSITVRDLFDPHSGGVRIRDWELQDLSNCPAVRNLFGFDALTRSSTDDDGPHRCMYTDSGVLLRGPDYYMNLTDRKSAAAVPDFLERAASFTDVALTAIDELIGLRPTPVLVKVALAVMDNIRDTLLQLLNVALFVAQPPGAVQEDDEVAVGSLGAIAAQHIRRYVDFLLEPHSPWSATLTACRGPIERLQSWIADNGSQLSRRVAERSEQPEWSAGDKKDIFRWREADYIVQNLSAVVIGLRAMAERRAESNSLPILAVGIQYGGLELPLLAAALGRRFGLILVPAVMRISMYGNREQGDEAREDLDGWVAAADPDLFPVTVLDDAGGAADGEHLPHDVVLFDDSCTTGTSVQAARDMLVRRGHDVRGVVIVRFPGANRFAHMALPAHGLLDLDLAHNFVQGLVGPSPYSRLVVPHPDKRYWYEDENGVFDKAKFRIRLLLHKNSPNKYAMPDAHAWGSAGD